MRLRDSGIQVIEPAIGQVVFLHGHPANHQAAGSTKSDTPIMITGGAYMGTHGISNFWDWDVLDESGDLIEHDCGYGAFTEVANKVQIVRTTTTKVDGVTLHTIER